MDRLDSPFTLDACIHHHSAYKAAAELCHINVRLGAYHIPDFIYYFVVLWGPANSQDLKIVQLDGRV